MGRLHRLSEPVHSGAHGTAPRHAGAPSDERARSSAALGLGSDLLSGGAEEPEGGPSPVDSVFEQARR